MTPTTRAQPRRVTAPAPMPDIDLDRLLKRLHLANTRRVWRDTELMNNVVPALNL